MAKKVEELLVYPKAVRSVETISSLINRTDICKDFELRDQFREAARSIVANIREGFSQQTDRQFVKFLYYAKGSANEIRGHLDSALASKYISKADVDANDPIFEEISKMLSGLIKYLKESDRKSRG